ncbi:MAG: hypothetical protein LUQ38_11290 [Methanotrichaceae archaeon]|nr:hypothetical protein [Methanotrichaceae archaeon]
MRICMLTLLVLAIAITMTSSAKLVEIWTYYSDSKQPASGALVYVDERYAGSTNDEGKIMVDIDLGNHSVSAQCTLAGKNRYKGQKPVNVTNDPIGAQSVWLSKAATRKPLCPSCD